MRVKSSQNLHRYLQLPIKVNLNRRRKINRVIITLLKESQTWKNISFNIWTLLLKQMTKNSKLSKNISVFSRRDYTKLKILNHKLNIWNSKNMLNFKIARERVRITHMEPPLLQENSLNWHFRLRLPPNQN